MFLINQDLYKKTIYFFGIFFVLSSLIKLQQNQISHIKNNLEKADYVEQEKYLKAKVKLQQNIPTFGFNNLFANWNYLQFIQYVGDNEARDITGYSIITDYFKTGVKQDPNFVQSHLTMSSANSLFAAEPEKTIEFLTEVSKKVNPEAVYYSFFLWTYKATDEILFLGDLEAAKNSYLMAAKWASLRQDELGEKLSKRYKTTANFLETNPDPSQAQFGAWMNILSVNKDEKTQDYVLNKLEELGAEINTSPDGKLEIKPPQLNQV